MKEKYIDIDELSEFVVQDYCNGRGDSFGQCTDQTEMTPNREKKGRAFVTSKPGAEHPVIDKYLQRLQSKFKPLMHVREVGEFGAGFSVVITAAGWPRETPKNMMKGDVKRFGEMMTRGYRTKTHTDYDAGRGTSHSCCTAMQDDALGILVNAKGEEEVIKLAKGESIIFSSSLFHFGCNHFDFSMAYDISYGEWKRDDNNLIISPPRYRIFLYLDHHDYSTKGNDQQIVDSSGQTTVHAKGIIDEHYVVNSTKAGTFDEAAKWLSDPKQDGWLWPMAELVDCKPSRGNGNGNGPVQKWDAEEEMSTKGAEGVKRKRQTFAPLL